MAKRKSRINAINHELRQIEKLKILEPNTTSPEARQLSDALADIALEALNEVHFLETGESPELKRLGGLVELVDSLPELVQVNSQHDKA